MIGAIAFAFAIAFALATLFAFLNMSIWWGVLLVVVLFGAIIWYNISMRRHGGRNVSGAQLDSDLRFRTEPYLTRWEKVKSFFGANIQPQTEFQRMYPEHH